MAISEVVFIAAVVVGMKKGKRKVVDIRTVVKSPFISTDG